MTSRIGRYELHDRLGHGGFGEVFRAYDPTLDGFVAIKTLKVVSEPDLVRRFRNEAAAARKLRHPNIVIVYDFGEQDGVPYLVMELLDGEDLDRIIAKHRSLTLLEKLDVMAQVASGLHHAHSNEIIHRDVKPANIMLLRDGTVKIMDFGIALLTQATAARETPKGAMIGTFAYMAPEHFGSGAPSDKLTDIFAYGITCYKLLTGVHPFHADEMSQLIYNIANKTPQSPRTISPECPEALEQAILKMLAKDRDSRYRSLEDARFDLEPIFLDLRQERVNDLTGEARRLISANDLHAAQLAVKRALEIDPGNRIARELREGLRRKTEEEEVRTRVAALTDAGREQLRARQFDAAIQKFESALRLDKSNPELRALIEQARADWQGVQRAGRLIQEARKSLENGDLTAAHKSVSEALKAVPEDAQAAELRAAIEARIEARERDRRLEDGISQAKGLMLLQSFDNALDRLKDLQKEYPESRAVIELLAGAETERENQSRRKRLQAGTDEAKALLRSSRYTEAIERLAQLQREFQEATELRELASYAAGELRAQMQAEAVSKCSVRVEELMEASEFDAALDLLRPVLAEYPGANALQELAQTISLAKRAAERRGVLDNTLAQAAQLIEKKQFQEAIAQMAAFVVAFGDSSAFEPLRRQAENGLHEQQHRASIRELTGDAEAMLAEGRSDSATDMLEQATVRFPGDPEITRLLGLARDRIEEQRNDQAISKIITEAESLARASQFDRALEFLDKGLQEYARADRLLRCREATIASQARDAREKALREALNESRNTRANGDLEGAVRTIEAALQRFGVDAALIDLKRRIEQEQAKRHRAAEVKRVVEQAQGLLDQGQFLSATQLLQPVTVRYPGERALTELMVAAEARIHGQKRPEDIPAPMPKAAKQVKTQLFDPAWHALDEGLRKQSFEGPAAKPWPWGWILAGTGAAAAAVTSLTLGPQLFHKPTITSVPVEILTDPPGATVRVGDRVCVTPNCRFDLKPDRYKVEVQLKGYQPAQQTVTVDGIRHQGVINLTLEPNPAPPPSLSGSTPAATGTLVIRAGLAGVLVFVDGVPRGRTDAKGEFSFPLEAKTYDVQLEKSGYQTPAQQRVKVGAGISQRVTFTLLPQLAYLQVRGAPAGVEFRAGAALLGRSDGSGLFRASLPPGGEVLRVSQGSASRQIVETINPGDTLSLAWRDIAPPAPTVGAEALEGQAWDRIRILEDTAQVQAFIDKYPNSVHLSEARSRLDDLTWAHLKGHDLLTLGSYLERFPHGRHAREAGDAGQLIVSSRADRQAVLHTLAELTQAIQQKDEASLKAIWPSIPASTLERWRTDFRNARSIQYELHPDMDNLSEIKGDTVSLKCGLSQRKIFDASPAYTAETAALISLQRAGKSWVIQSIR